MNNNCLKCGEKLNNEYRCCMYCGALNPNHPDSAKTIENIKNDNHTQNNAINNSNKNLTNNINNVINANNFSTTCKIYNESKKTNSTLNNIMFIVLNFMCFVLLTVCLKNDNNIVSSIVVSIIVYFYFVCYQLLLIKANLHWWGLFIPVYNLYLINKLSFGNGWVFLGPIILLISIIICIMFGFYNIFIILFYLFRIIILIYPTILIFCLGRRFGRSGIITVLFTFIIIPTIAFSKKYTYLY